MLQLKKIPNYENHLESILEWEKFFFCFVFFQYIRKNMVLNSKFLNRHSLASWKDISNKTLCYCYQHQFKKIISINFWMTFCNKCVHKKQSKPLHAHICGSNFQVPPCIPWSFPFQNVGLKVVHLSRKGSDTVEWPHWVSILLQICKDQYVKKHARHTMNTKPFHCPILQFINVFQLEILQSLQPFVVLTSVSVISAIISSSLYTRIS